MARWERICWDVGAILVMGVVLAGVILPSAGSHPAKREAAVEQMRQFREGLERFCRDVGRYPTEAEGLEALMKDPGVAGWRGPYWKPDGKFGEGEVVLPHDPWGNAYQYVVPGEKGKAYGLSSDGADGVVGTGDDVLPP